MSLITYTAKRNLKTNHAIGEVHNIQIALQKLDDEQPKPITDMLKSLNGNVVTTLHRIERYIDVTTGWIPSDGVGFPGVDDFTEFFDSVAGGETFTFNAADGPNLITHSNEFDHADWLDVGSPVVVANVAADPYGRVVADTVEDQDAGVFEYIYQAFTLTDPAISYIGKVNIKKDAVGRATRFPALRLQFSGTATEANYIFLDTATGEISTILPSVAAAGVNDNGAWWELWIAGPSTNQSNNLVTLLIQPAYGASASWVFGVAATGTITVANARLHALTGADQSVRLAGDPTRQRDGLHYSYSFRMEIVS